MARDKNEPLEEAIPETDADETGTDTDETDEDIEETPVEKPAPAPRRAATTRASAAKPPVVEEAVAEPATEKLRRVRGMKDHECHIGGVNYVIKRGAVQNLPHTVAAVLQHGGFVSVI